MKTIKYIIATVALLAAVTFTAQAQPFYGSVNVPVINTGVTNAGGTKGASGTVQWTNGITAAFTNLTLINQTGVRETALQFQANIMATNASAVTVTWQLARSVSGGSATNGAGTGLLLDYFATVTNTIAINTTASPVLTVNLTSLPPSALPTGVACTGTWNDGAIPYIYVFSMTPSAGTVTNTTVYAAGL